MLEFIHIQDKCKIYILIIFTFIVQIGLAQNLVPNGDFEQYTICPSYIGHFPPAPWIKATEGNPDYYNQCATVNTCDVPSNFTGFQYARSGSGYCGIGVFTQSPFTATEYREYIETQLITPLIIGNSYDFKMYVSLANKSKIAISDIGVYFSVGQVLNLTSFTPLLLSPQITNVSGPVTDTLNWILIDGSFIATGGEDHIIIGNFKNDANTNYLINNIISNDPFSYYYIDDVSLETTPPCQIELGNDTTICQGETLTLDVTMSNASYLWQDNSTSPIFNITQQGTYWVQITNSCGTFTDTINVNFNPVPSINLGNDTSLCLGETLTLDATALNASYLWQDNSTNPTFSITQQGTYWIRITTNNCNSFDTIIVNYDPLPIINLGNDTTLCQDETLTLDVTLSNASYLWQDNSTNSTFNITKQGSYWIEVTNRCYISTDTLAILIENCDCIVFIPNSFTPNSDYINDEFSPKFNCNLTEYSFLIFNRWGELVFKSNNQHNSWDGYYQGNISPIGVYNYSLEYKFKGINEKKYGHINLLK